jgi:hypothetical protein
MFFLVLYMIIYSDINLFAIDLKNQRILHIMLACVS